MMKAKKYKVDEWVFYNVLMGEVRDHTYSLKAVILNICPLEDFYDYEIYIEKTQKFRKVKEEYLFPLKEF